jgi:hypothetical protein
VISRGLVAVLGILIGVGYAVVVANVVEGHTAQTILAAIGAVVITIGTLAAIDKVDDEPPTAH